MDLTEHLHLYGSQEDAFVAAAENSRTEIVKELLARGVNVNCRDSRFGHRALHRAASRGSVKMVSLLLDHQADINSLDGNDLTPLAVACSTGKKKGSSVALLLLERGADATYVRAADGMTAFGFALWGQRTPEVLAALERAGAGRPDGDFKVIRLAGR